MLKKDKTNTQQEKCLELYDSVLVSVDDNELFKGFVVYKTEYNKHMFFDFYLSKIIFKDCASLIYKVYYKNHNISIKHKGSFWPIHKFPSNLLKPCKILITEKIYDFYGY